MIPEIHIEDYDYQLPEERIAKYPLPERDSSKLLVYKDGGVSERVFSEIPELLPKDTIMVFNDTKVVPARLHFQRETGAHIEIFCLSPVSPAEYNLSFNSTQRCSWKCVIGNAKKWKGDELKLYNPEDEEVVSSMGLKASLLQRDGETGIVEFFWQDGSPFSRVLEVCGTIPIPPYLDRDTEAIDKERYQTVYAQYRGSVAAPTAGLHFTEKELDAISANGIDRETVCLHVGAGTFLPVKSPVISGHPMHREPFSVSKDFLKECLSSGKKLIAVGTTSVRTLESLYYVGLGILRDGKPSDVPQWSPYEECDISTEDALNAIVKYLDDNGLETLEVGTRIIIVPGFKFRMVDAMVTNFHQPKSTLMLLVAAFIGEDWRKVYGFALERGFRFLSYGDSSLLFRNDSNKA